ncbi:MAG TPA: AAA family ATPase [Pseudomonadales bacterium]
MAASNEVETPFVGRGDALQSLEAAFEAAAAGRGGLVAVSGEPGIGKTCTVETFARRVEDRGVLVLWGRCLEQPGAPPYWPWSRIVRDYTEASSLDELHLRLGADAAALATLVPELGERLGLPPSVDGKAGSGTEQRFRLFDAVTRVLLRAAADDPVMLVIDDLHWADPSSLSLLEYLSEEIRRQRLLIVCAYRDLEVVRHSPLLATLGALTRARRLQRIRLSGLDPEDTATLASAVIGEPIPAPVAGVIFQQTDGNPLFVHEVARVVAEERRHGQGPMIAVDVPDGVREAIGRRLDRLSSRCNDMLTVAAVAGRAFDLRVVAAALGQDLEQTLGELDQAVQAGLVQSLAGSRGGHHFTHALIRETLYDETATVERLRWHRRIAEALETLYPHDDEILSELAYHACEAASLGGWDRAVDLALRAAERDEQVFALEEAARHYELAVRTLRANGREDDPRAARGWYRKAYVELAAGQADTALVSARHGADLARATDPELLSRNLEIMVRVASNSDQQSALPLLEEALRLLPEEAASRRSSMYAHLAVALRTVSPERVDAMGSEAVALARRTGEADVLMPALRLWATGLRLFPQTIAQRLALGREALELAPLCRDAREVAEAMYFHLLNLMAAGELEEFVPLLARYQKQAEALHLGRHLHQATLLTIALRLLRGDWAGLEQQLEQALEQGRRLDRHDPDGVYGTQMFQLNRELGRLAALKPLVQRLLTDPAQRLWAPGLMVVCLETGLDAEARQAFERLAGDGFSGIPNDDVWLASMAFCAETCARLGDAARAPILYEALLPYAGQTAWQPATLCLGCVDFHLGLLADAAGRRQAAVAHLEAAIDRNRAMQAWPPLARTQTELGRLLLDADPPAAKRVLTDAEQLAGRLGMSALTARIAALLDGGAAGLPDGLTPREIDVLKLLAIGRSNKDVSRVLGISLSTVATHVRSILEKTGCANRTEAAAYALRHDLD